MSPSTKYALTSGLNTDKLINYNTTWGLKQWTEATKKLGENHFYGSPQNLRMSLERLYSRVAGWKNIVKINGKDLLTHYGTIPIEDIRTAGNGYLTQDTEGEQKSKECSTVITDVDLYSSILLMSVL